MLYKVSKKVILVLLLWIPILSNAQDARDNEGLKFNETLNWQQLKAKAKADNKYIFIDCYASWCGPCKMMDQEVFSSHMVAAKVNNSFISARCRMDIEASDTDQSGLNAADAEYFKSEFKVVNLPTYLFFSADGKLVHRDEGYKNTGQFIALLNDATDENFQIYTLLDRYLRKDISGRKTIYLAKSFQLFDPKMADSIAMDYYANTISKQDSSNFYTRENIDFISTFPSLINGKQEIINFFRHQAPRIDSIIGSAGYSRVTLKTAIMEFAIKPYVLAASSQGRDPEWGRIFEAVKRRYGNECAMSSLLEAEVTWSKDNKKWKQYVYYLKRQVEYTKAPNIDPLDLNDMAWNVFLYSTDRDQLKMALSWVENSLTRVKKLPCIEMDTKAN
ncbi:MAG TPA: thioredoxin fold domain-containing protein, partial [Mucilaginibacter sp.]